MGGCISLDMLEMDEDRRMHMMAERELRVARRQLNHEVKVLLLGSGDSGKSTIVKQMRYIHKVPFTNTEIEHFRKLVFANIVNGMATLLDAMQDFDMKPLERNVDAAFMLQVVDDLKDGEAFPVEYLEPLQSLWTDPNVQKAWERGNEAAVPENLSYFFADLDRFFTPSYKPTPQDIVRCRSRTTGIIETVFDLKSHELHMVDVGGQKSERRKWIHCFQDVRAILFLVSLSGYDQCLSEDKSANQMADALMVWKSICQSVWFRDTPIILFLNKEDLFFEKISHSHIEEYFPDFQGPKGDPHAGRLYFKKQFLETGDRQARGVYVNFTTATDTALLTRVMSGVDDIILRSNMESAHVI